jgi:hypothetical protein
LKDVCMDLIGILLGLGLYRGLLRAAPLLIARV